MPHYPSSFFQPSSPFQQPRSILPAHQNALSRSSIAAKTQGAIKDLLRTMHPRDTSKDAIRALIQENKEGLNLAHVYSLHYLNHGLLNRDEKSILEKDDFGRVLLIKPANALTEILSIMCTYNILTPSNFLLINKGNLLYLVTLLTLNNYSGNMTKENANQIFNELLKNKKPSYEFKEYIHLKDLICWSRNHLSPPIAHKLFMHLISFLNSIDFLNKESLGELLSSLFTQGGAFQLPSAESIYALIEKLDYAQEYNYLHRAKTHSHSSTIAHTLFILYYNQLLFSSNGKYNFISIITSRIPLVLNEIFKLLDHCNLLSATDGQKNLSLLLATVNEFNCVRIKTDLQLLKHYKLLEKDAQLNFEKVLKSEMVTEVLLTLDTKELLTTPYAQKHFEALLKFSNVLLEDEKIYSFWINSDMNEVEFLDLISICELNNENPKQMEFAVIAFFENLNAPPSLHLITSPSTEELMTSTLTASF